MENLITRRRRRRTFVALVDPFPGLKKLVDYTVGCISMTWWSWQKHLLTTYFLPSSLHHCAAMSRLASRLVERAAAWPSAGCKGAITSKIKHAIKLNTSPARLAQLLQPSLAFCFSLQPMTAYRPGLDGTPSLRAATVVQVSQALCYMFIACFILLVIAPLHISGM